MKVLYHANCNDGAGAALAFQMCWDEKPNDPIEYIPVQYGSEPPNIADDHVYILDFSYPREVVSKMAKTAGSITIIDHHKTAKADLEKPFPDMLDSVRLCDVRVIFDMSKSGAVLTWEHVSREPVPALLLHIQDRDLWNFDMLGTRHISSGLQLYPDWRDWIQFIENPELLGDLMTQGAAIVNYLRIQADKIIATKPRLWDIEPDIIPIYNLPGFMLSDTLHAALVKYPDSPYAVGYFDLANKRIYSLRSRKGTEIDVSEIAKKHGGGGHKHAADFAFKLIWTGQQSD